VERVQPEARVRVRDGLGDVRRPITLVEVAGAHDWRTGAVLISALERIDGPLIVDLTVCDALDEDAIAAIIAKASALGKGGHRFEFLAPPDGPLLRAFEPLRQSQGTPYS
jgi:hypothetical protein